VVLFCVASRTEVVPSHYDDLQTFDLAIVGRFSEGRPSEELDELIEMARTIRMTPEQGNPTSRKARDVGHPRRSFAYGNVKIENDSITWEMVDRAAEQLEKEK
jgi:hypothetical protein